MANIIQTLIETSIERPVEDVDVWVDRLTGLADEIDHTRDVSPRLLTENEAEVLVRYYGTHQTRQDVADTMGLSPNRIDRLRHAAEEDVLAAEATLDIFGDLRDGVRADTIVSEVEAGGEEIERELR